MSERFTMVYAESFPEQGVRKEWKLSGRNLMRMSSGLLKSYQVIELMRSDQMANALRKSNEYVRMEQEMPTKQ